MANIVWVPVNRIFCEHRREDADLLEERVYPGEVVPAGVPYQVRSRRCAFDLECNMAGYQCRWSMTNPDYDPFKANSV